MIKAYIGDIGSGKTLLMVKDAQWFFKNGYEVYSNMPMWGYKKGRRSDSNRVVSIFLYPDEFMERVKNAFIQRKPTLFVIDEATLVLSAYNWSKTDAELLMFISQSRKFNIHIFYTSQRFKDVIVPLRENATHIVECKKFLFKPFYLFRGLVLDKTYFLDKAKSHEKKQYIKGRKLYFPYLQDNYYERYISHFIVMTKTLHEKFKDFMYFDTNFNPDSIVKESQSHIDIQPPV